MSLKVWQVFRQQHPTVAEAATYVGVGALMVLGTISEALAKKFPRLVSNTSSFYDEIAFTEASCSSRPYPPKDAVRSYSLVSVITWQTTKTTPCGTNTASSFTSSGLFWKNWLQAQKPPALGFEKSISSICDRTNHPYEDKCHNSISSSRYRGHSFQH